MNYYIIRTNYVSTSYYACFVWTNYVSFGRYIYFLYKELTSRHISTFKVREAEFVEFFSEIVLVSSCQTYLTIDHTFQIVQIFIALGLVAESHRLTVIFVTQCAVTSSPTQDLLVTEHVTVFTCNKVMIWTTILHLCVLPNRLAGHIKAIQIGGECHVAQTLG